MFLPGLDTACNFIAGHGVQINGGYDFLPVLDLLHLLHATTDETDAGLVSTALLVLCNIQIIGLELLLGERQGLRVQKVVHGAGIAVRNRVFMVTGRLRFFLLLQVHLHLLQIIGILVCRDLETQFNGLLGN